MLMQFIKLQFIKTGKFFPMDLDFGQDSKELKKLEVSKSTSKLDKAIQQLISMIFDIESMKKTMIEFEVRYLYS